MQEDSILKSVYSNNFQRFIGGLDLKLIEAHIDTSTNNLFLGVYFFVNDSLFLLGDLGNGLGNIPDGVVISLRDTTFLHFTSGIWEIKNRTQDFSLRHNQPLKKFVDSNLHSLSPIYISLLQRHNIIP